jgi:hypothetical protein
MTRIMVRHQTTYRNDRPVGFRDWRLMMRPIDSHALRLPDARLELTPHGRTHWFYDASGNSVCTFQPGGESDILSVTSVLELKRFPTPLRPLGDDAPATTPVVYDFYDRTVLAPFIEPALASSDGGHDAWVRGIVIQDGEQALGVLTRLTLKIHSEFTYGERNEVGTQTPAETVALRSGTCRDFAWLMIETARRLGFAARFVTGYVFSPGAGIQGAGATHAWCEVFLPRLGWIEFDPTNAIAESQDLIRVAATRTPEEASPMTGEIDREAVSTMEVKVDVEKWDD